MHRERPLSARVTGLAVAALLIGSTVVVPLLHAGETGAGARYTASEAPATSSFQHDHAVCVQLQTSTPRAAAPPTVPTPPGRPATERPPRRSPVTSHDGRLLDRARAPPRTSSA